MSNESVPLPHGDDLQVSNTQAIIEKANAIQGVVSELIEVGHRWHLSNNDKVPLVRVEIEPGTTHKALWEKYSSEVQSERPVQRSLTVAQTALQAGHSLEEVQNILAHDPQSEKVGQQYGPEKAQEYVQGVTRSATYREELARQQEQHQLRQQQKSRTQNHTIGIG